MDRQNLYDSEAVRQRFRNAAEFKNQAAKSLSICTENLDLLHRAIKTGNTRAQERTAYRIGRALSELSAYAALDIAIHLERQGRIRDQAQSPQTLTLLKFEIHRLKTALDLPQESANAI